MTAAIVSGVVFVAATLVVLLSACLSPAPRCSCLVDPLYGVDSTYCSEHSDGS